jgi:hypothetical protein
MKTTKFLLLIIAAFLITNTASARDTHTLKNASSRITISSEGLFWPRRHFRHERRHPRRAIIIARHHRRKKSF